MDFNVRGVKKRVFSKGIFCIKHFFDIHIAIQHNFQFRPHSVISDFWRSRRKKYTTKHSNQKQNPVTGSWLPRTYILLPISLRLHDLNFDLLWSYQMFGGHRVKNEVNQKFLCKIDLRSGILTAKNLYFDTHGLCSMIFNFDDMQSNLFSSGHEIKIYIRY